MGEGKGKFSQCQMEEQLAPLSLLQGWIFLYHSNTHIYSQTNTHTELPPVILHHLASTWSSKQDQGGLSSLVDEEETLALEEGKGTNPICFLIWFLCLVLMSDSALSNASAYLNPLSVILRHTINPPLLLICVCGQTCVSHPHHPARKGLLSM